MNTTHYRDFRNFPIDGNCSRMSINSQLEAMGQQKTVVYCKTKWPLQEGSTVTSTDILGHLKGPANSQGRAG